MDLYEEAYDEKRPVVCFDERPCQLVEHTREPLTMGEGRPARKDHEYERRGMAHLFMAFEPLGGWRSVEVHERRRSGEFALAVARLAEEVYPQAERARELCRRVEFVYTPVHGSWLNMVEVELSVLVRQCLRRRIPEAEVLRREAQAWERERNRLGTSADWRFTTDDARTKLRKLYPSIEP